MKVNIGSVNNSQSSSWDEIPKDRYMYAIQHPWMRRKLVNVSIEQDREGSHYHGILNNLALDCVGPAPIIIGTTDNEDVNAQLEDNWLTFCAQTGLGQAIRLVRRAAARTGIGIAIPYKKETPNPIKLGFRVISARKLKTPMGSTEKDRIYDGVEYNENWEPIKIYLDTGEEYEVKDIIFWWKQKDEENVCGIPECSPALCIFPSVKRYLDSIIRSAEFRSSIPMAIKLDPNIWGKQEASAAGIGLPKGKWKYEPGMIPTLLPGTTLEGLSYSGSTSEDIDALDAVVGAAARCINMPINLATGNSSKHNMASSQVDFGPWQNYIRTDREDFVVVPHKIIKIWMDGGVEQPKYFSSITKKYIDTGILPYALSYGKVFNHPDPQKISNSTMTDFISGALTLVEYYTSTGRNPRRVLTREAQLLNIEYDELCKIILAGRTPATLQILNQSLVNDNQPQ